MNGASDSSSDQACRSLKCQSGQPIKLHPLKVCTAGGEAGQIGRTAALETLVVPELVEGRPVIMLLSEGQMSDYKGAAAGR